MQTRKEISEFYRKHRLRLYNAALRITGDQMDAEEVMQDTIIKYLNIEAGETMTEEQVGSWLYKTCVRGAIDVVRRRKRNEAFLEEYKEDAKEEQKGGAWRTLIEEKRKSTLVKKIRESLGFLPDGYRTVLSLILFEGYDYEEVARILNVKEVTVRSQYMRGKQKLAELINL